MTDEDEIVETITEIFLAPKDVMFDHAPQIELREDLDYRSSTFLLPCEAFNNIYIIDF